MLKKRLKNYIINLIILINIIVLSMPAVVCAEDDDFDYKIRPAYIFQFSGSKDPFEPRHKRDITVNVEETDISTLMLLGITDSDGAKAALFRSKNGSPFGFILMNGKLYGDNGNAISGIVGEIEDEKSVKLVQGDNEVVFSLEENFTGPNIRPE